jgi:hypothetical protein
VQFYALSILELLDQIKETNAEDRQLRTTLLVAGLMDYDVAFPELANVVEDDSAELPPEVDKDGNPVSTKYVFSNATYDPKAVEEEIREMLARAAQAEASLDEVRYDEWV